jgi:hypothetical protein
VKQCIFCHRHFVSSDNAPEHVLLNALGGRKETQDIDCSACNNRFGSEIDREVAHQVAVIRNLFGLRSGDGKPPPGIRNVQAGEDVINLRNDGTPQLVTKPFKVTQSDDGQVSIFITGEFYEDIAGSIRHIAKQLDWSEQQVIATLRGAEITHTTRRPDNFRVPLSMGGPNAIRSHAKSALVLWALATSNDHVLSAPYDAVRRFIVDGDFNFACEKTHLDSRPLPEVEKLIGGYGPLFNLIYVKSDTHGRVTAHFTLYNVAGWQIVLADHGGQPNVRIGLISNPITLKWSDAIADDLDLAFSWLNDPTY